MSNYEILNVELNERNYDILVGTQLLRDSGELIKSVIRTKRVIIITDEKVASLYLEPLVASITSSGLAVESIILPEGERTKSFTHYEEVVNQVLKLRIDRKSALIALGGGVIGDLTGFIAASLMRGIDFIQIPTTLLSQVDSSIGGKTGINTIHGKNLVGAFHQPRLVLSDIDTLDSLPNRQVLCGYAEIAKYGLINAPNFFDWLEQNASELCAGDKHYRREAVLMSCRSKAKIIARDETDKDVRALLNLGHTFGHALEAECGFSDKLLHGESISIGICMAFDLSVHLGFCDKIDAKRTRKHLNSVGLPTDPGDIPDVEWNADSILNHMLLDKKVEDGKLTFILAKRIGESFIAHDISKDHVLKILRNVTHNR